MLYCVEYRMLSRILPTIVLLLFLCTCGNDTGSGPLAPDFLLKDMAGNKVTLKQYRGKVVLLDFWATWCPPCRAAVPDLVALQTKYEKELVILGISMDSPVRVNDERLKRFGEKLKINYPIIRYDLHVVENYFGDKAPSLPTVYVIDRNGRVRDRLEGHDPKALTQSLKGLLS